MGPINFNPENIKKKSSTVDYKGFTAVINEEEWYMNGFAYDMYTNTVELVHTAERYKSEVQGDRGPDIEAINLLKNIYIKWFQEYVDNNLNKQNEQ